MNKFRIITATSILALGIWVALSPSVVYAPTPRIILYALVSFLPAILFGLEAASKFVMKLPGFCFTTMGAAAICFGMVFLLTYLSKPEEKIAVFRVLDEKNQPVSLEPEGALVIPVTEQGLTVTRFVAGNTAVIIFPEQVGRIDLLVKKSSLSPTYSGSVTYAGSRSSLLILGRDLNEVTR